MRSLTGALLWIGSAILFPGAGRADRLIGTPDGVPTAVAADGTILTAWGSVRILPLGEAGQPVTEQNPRPAPTPVTRYRAGPLDLAVSAFRAPLWPQPCDAVVVSARNTGTTDLRSGFRLEYPGGLTRQGGVVAGNRRRLIALAPPQAVVECEGCLTDAMVMRGWGHPNRACDPGFGSIRAGMGGIPIHYRFSLVPGGKLGVVLGFCEGHWDTPGKRPVAISVEGAEGMGLDAVARFGHKTPGAVAFEGSDANRDGKLDIRVLPVQGAPDTNTILNLLWLFPADAVPPIDEVITGRHNDSAIHRVDVGGEQDGPIYRPAEIRTEARGVVYELELGPAEEATFPFLLALGDGSVFAWDENSWTPDAVRKAADRVWAGVFARAVTPVRAESTSGATLRTALAEALMCRVHADAFELPFTAPVPSRESFSLVALERLTRVLEETGLGMEAERCLRPLWDEAVPAQLQAFCNRKGGLWSGEDPVESAHGLVALCRHGLQPGKQDWAQQAFPRIREASEAIKSLLGERGATLTADAQARCAWALVLASRLAESLGEEAVARAFRQDLPTAANPPSDAVYTELGPVVAGVGNALQLLGPEPE